MIPTELKLVDLLSTNDLTFFIPPYQRNYEWDRSQCEVFFNDICKTRKSNVEGTYTEHFFGTVTYFISSGSVLGGYKKIVLIDGQQRITTTMLFLLAIRDCVDDEIIQRTIEEHYLKNSRSANTEYKIKLKQVESDWQIYKDLIMKIDIEGKDKTTAIYKNYDYFCNKIRKLKEENFDLSSLIEEGLGKFSIISVELQPDRNKWESPQEIFESMNSLGKPLSLADLVRNWLLLNMPPAKQEDLYNRYWLPMERYLEKQISNFIRDYMQCVTHSSYKQATETNYKSLYRSFKSEFEGKDKEDLLQTLSCYAPLYGYIALGNTCGSLEIDKKLDNIRTLTATTTYSFILGLLAKWKENIFTDQDIIDILDVLFIFVLRRRLVRLTAPENKKFPEMVAQINKLVEAPNKRDEMFRLLANQENSFRLPNDIECSKNISEMNFYNFKLAKFVLALIEEKITKARPEYQDTKLQIEHIMPQTLDNEWIAELGDNAEDIHQQLVNCIGNLTLIRHNQELGQKKFSEKKKIYDEKSGLQIAKTKITDKEKWDKISINERTEWLVKFLLNEVIPIPKFMRRTNNYRIKNEVNRLSFNDLGLVGEEINFIADKGIIAKVVGDTEVDFEGKRWKLSPLTAEIHKRRGEINASHAYRGAVYWEYDGIKLLDWMLK